MNQEPTAAQPAQPREGARDDFQSEAARNHALMPEASRWIAELKRVFGPGIKVRWVREGNEERGRRDWAEVRDAE